MVGEVKTKCQKPIAHRLILSLSNPHSYILPPVNRFLGEHFAVIVFDDLLNFFKLFTFNNKSEGFSRRYYSKT